MTISLLYIVVPTILVLAVLIYYINSRNKVVMKEIGELKTQLEKMDNVPVSLNQDLYQESDKNYDLEGDAEEKIEAKETGEEEEKDAVGDSITDNAASAYNTGKSGKIYTKEELELLIKE